MASTSQMVQLHEDLVSGKTPAMQVDSIGAANKVLSAQSAGSPQVPNMPADHVMACCMKSVKDKKVACVLLEDAGVPLTLTVANAADMSLPTSPTVNRGGVVFHVQSYSQPKGTLNMVMAERNGHWICLIGSIPAEKLMDIASQIRF